MLINKPMKYKNSMVVLLVTGALLIAGSLYRKLPAAKASPNLTITPITWNIVGLDSNDVNVGPNKFPVGVRVCNAGTTAATNVTSAFIWDTSDPYITLSPGTLSDFNSNKIPSVAAGACTDFYYEVVVTRNAAAYKHARRYHITAAADTLGTISTPRPREIYVEYLISQGRNNIKDLKLNNVSVPASGTIVFEVGKTYNLTLVSSTVTGGSEQIESFINLPNTIFQILSVSTSYTADSSPLVSNPDDKLYGNGCNWENDPNSPNYRSCLGDGKAGGEVAVNYTLKILSSSLGPVTLGNLIYDFSGSSFHYNSDNGSQVRLALIFDPATVTINKSFEPTPIPAGGTSALNFTISNPNAFAVSGVNFTDTFPTTPGAMVVANPTIAMSSGCGTPTLAPVAGAGSISVSNATVAANSSCKISLNVTAPTEGTYNNTTNNLFIGTTNTGNSGSASLTVTAAPAAPAPVCGLTLASWTFPTGFSTSAPAPSVNNASASAAVGAGLSESEHHNSSTTTDGTLSWGTNGSVDSGGTLNTANNDFFQFAINTSNLSAVTISFDVHRTSHNSPDTIAIYASTSTKTAGGAEPGTLVYTSSAILRTMLWETLSSITINPANLNSAGTTYFRFYLYNAGNSNPSADLFIDNVRFTGCLPPSQPTLAKSFFPATVAVNGTSTLTFTLTNPNILTELNSVAFNDTLPAGVTVTSGSSTQCGGTLTRTAPDMLSFSGGTIAISGSCTITATVTVMSAGPQTNVSGFITSTEGGTNSGASGFGTAMITGIGPPLITKRFATNPISQGTTTVLTFTLENPNINTALAGVAFADTFPTLPSAMTLATIPGATTSGCGTPTFTTVAGSGSISLSGATIAAGGTCTVSVNVATAGAGTFVNTSGSVSHFINGTTVNGTSSTDSLVVKPVNPSIKLLKLIGPTATGPWTPFLARSLGQNVFYKLTIENTGDQPLTSVLVTDPDVNTSSCFWPTTLPVGTTTVDPTASCVVGPITAVAGARSNTATASGVYSATTVSSTSTASYGTTALTLVKSVTQANFNNAGDTLNYSYLVTNSGFAPLIEPFTVSDNKISSVTCPSTTTVGDNDNYLDIGESLTCTATYTVTAADMTAQKITNTANATADGVSSNTSSVTILLNGATNLTLSKTNGVTTVTAGGTTTYTLTVTNNGNITSSGTMTMVDVLPTGMTIADGVVTETGAQAANWICTALSNVVTCTSTTAIASSGMSVFGFLVNVTTGATGSLVNKAQVGGGGDSTNSSAPTTTTVGQCAGGTPLEGCATDTEQVDQVIDLVLQMNGTSVVLTGGTVIYTVKITNMGPSDGDGSTFSGTLPASLTGITGSCGGANAGAVCPGSVTLTGNNFSGSIPSLPPGGSIILTFVGTAPNIPGVISSTATVTRPAGATETNTSNNNGTVTTEVINQSPPAIANLAVTKVGTSTVQSAGSIQWQVVVTNAGEGAANGAIFTDTIPGAVTGVTWTCTAVGGAVCPSVSGSGNPISQTIATFPATGQLIYTISGTAPATTQTLTNTASINPPAGVTDPETADNGASVSTVVQSTAPTTADLIISKVGPANVIPNASFSYKIIVRNAGPAAANGATVSDSLPNALTGSIVACAASGGAACGTQTVGAGNLLTATITTLPKYGEVTYTVTATAPATGYFSNSAVVTPPSGVNDPDPLDNASGPVITGVVGNQSQQVDLAITKTDGVTTAIPGASHSYTIVASNVGLLPVTGATVVDNFSTQFSSAQWTCVGTGTTCPNANGTGNLNETVNLPVGASLTYRINTRISLNATGGLTNTAMVNVPSGFSDIDLTNNMATDGNTLLVPTSDLVIQPNATPLFETGGVISYTFEVTNLGPSYSTNVPVQSTLGGGFTVTSISCGSAVDGAVCPGGATLTPGLVSATIPLLPAGGNLVFTVVGLVPLTATDITNLATVSAPPGAVDPNTETNTGTVTAVVAEKLIPPDANIKVTKAGTNVVQINGSVGYMITVTNAGPYSANGVVLTDNVPAGFTNVVWNCVASGDAVCPNASGTGSPIVQTIATFPVNGQLIYRVTATAPSTPTAILVGDSDHKSSSVRNIQTRNGISATQVAGDVTVTLPSGVVDVDPTDNQAVAVTKVTTGVPPVADVTIAKTGPTNTTSYGLLTYTLEVTNNGPDPADGTVVTDDLSNLLTNVGATCSAQNGAVCGPITIVAGGVVRAEIPTFPEFGRVVYKVTATAPLSGFFSSSATLTLEGGQNDPSFEDNTGGPVNTFVGPFSADLVIQNNGTPIVKTNEPVVYTLLLTNLGPRSAGGATLRNILPPGLGNVSVVCSNATAGAACPSSLVISDGILTGTIPTFPPGGNITITIRGTAPGYLTTLINQASIIPPGPVPDPILGNNTASALTRVTDSPIPLAANLTVTKQGSSTVQVGGTVLYQVLVVNSGPASADGAIFTDLVPASITGVTWTCTPAGGALCPAPNGSGNSIVQTIGILPVNGSLTYVINGTAQATAQSLSNTAVVSLPPGITDVDPTDNTSTALTTVQTTVLPLADLVIAKTGPSNVTSGATFAYTIEVTNTGPAQVNGAVVTDNLSDLLSNVSVTCTAVLGAVCGPAVIGAGNQLTATIATLPVEGRVTYIITASAPGIGFFSNSAVVTTPPEVDDPDPIDNLGGPVITSTITLPTIPRDHAAGSILIYNVYTSKASTHREDTRITLTNSHPRQAVNVHLFFIDGATRRVADNYVSVTPQQTVSFLASDLDPGVTGYILAVAVDNHGCPINFNYLMGSEYVKFESGHRTSLDALAIPAEGWPIICDPNAATAKLNFDGISYRALPRMLAIDSLASRSEDNQTMLIVNRIGGDLTTALDPVETLAGFIFDNLEKASIFMMSSANNQFRAMLGNSTPRSVPRYDLVIPAGRSGWMKFASVANVGLTGAVINQNANGFSGGHNLHMLTTTPVSFITIPVYPPQ